MNDDKAAKCEAHNIDGCDCELDAPTPRMWQDDDGNWYFPNPVTDGPVNLFGDDSGHAPTPAKGTP